MKIDSIKTRIKNSPLTLGISLTLLLLSAIILFTPAIGTDNETYTVLDVALGDYELDCFETLAIGVALFIFCAACLLFKVLPPDSISRSGFGTAAMIFYFIAMIALFGVILSLSASSIYDLETKLAENYDEWYWYKNIFENSDMILYTSSADIYIACLVLNTIGFLSVFLDAINETYSGAPLMSLKEKLLEIPIQIALIPVSAIISLLSCTIVLLWVPYLLIDRIWFGKLKPTTYYGESYDVGESYYDVKNKVSHDIKDKDGNVIGSFDTTEIETKYDSGARHWGIGNSTIYALAFFALPLRIVSFILSLFAPFMRKLYIHVRDLGLSTMTYDAKSFALLDLIETK